MSIVLCEDRGPVRHVVINRPEKRNALNAEVIAALHEAFADAAADRDVTCVVVRGAGPMFSSGMDFAALGALAADPGGLQRAAPADPRGVEPARGDAEADDRADPRRVPRRRDGARPRVRPADDGGRRDHGPAGDADRADPGRRRLVAAAERGRARAGEGADHDLEARRRDRGRADRARQPRRARGRPRRGDRHARRRAAGSARRSPSRTPSA